MITQVHNVSVDVHCTDGWTDRWTDRLMKI